MTTPLTRVAAARAPRRSSPCGCSPPAAPTTPRVAATSGGESAAPPSRCCCPSPRPPATRPSTSRCSRPRSPSSAPTARSYYYNADQDEAKQAQQVDYGHQRGRRRGRARPGQRRGRRRHGRRGAGRQDIPVIAYDRFIAEADYYMSFDNETVGKMQGEALVEAMGDKGNILMLNGAPSDPNAAQFKAGAHSVIDEQRRRDPRGVRQPRLEPGERAAVRPPTSSASTTPPRSRASTPPTTARPAAWSRP